MASTFRSLFITSLISSISIILVSSQDHDYVKSPDPNKHLGLKKEKLSYIHLYWHDVVDGPNPTSVTIVPPPSNSSKTRFGLIRMFDNALTLGPHRNSKLIGKAQGFYGIASQEDFSLLSVQNFAFTEGKYKGSTVTLLGRNPIMEKVRELPVIGGSGRFRFARGYAIVTTQYFNLTKGENAVVEYHMYVLHH